MEESEFKMYLMRDGVPISNEEGEIISRVREWDRNSGSAKDFDGTKATSSFMEIKRWEIEEASNLIFDLKGVSEVLSRRDGTCGAIDSILVRVSPLLNTIPVQSNSKAVSQMIVIVIEISLIPSSSYARIKTTNLKSNVMPKSARLNYNFISDEFHVNLAALLW